MLTEIQKARVRFHLGYPSDRPGLLEVQQQLILNTLAPVTETQLIGDISDPSGPVIDVSGLVLAHESSMLGRVELAYLRLSPTVIDDSLFVESAGAVVLRRDELRARQALYDTMVDQLAQLLDVDVFGRQAHGPSFRY